MDCTVQIQLWYRLCLAILGLFGSLFAMHLGYSLTLGKRTAKLEKKNGHERSQLGEQLEQINQLQEKIKKLEQKFSRSEPEKK